MRDLNRLERIDLGEGVLLAATDEVVPRLDVLLVGDQHAHDENTGNAPEIRAARIVMRHHQQRTHGRHGQPWLSRVWHASEPSQSSLRIRRTALTQKGDWHE